MLKTIVCTITNDISYDQRMKRICTSLSNAGYNVILIGFERKNSLPLAVQPYQQIRIKGIPAQGKIMYFVYWIKLFFKLMTIKADAFCAIDLDTILPVYYASLLRGKKRVYDAHEIFTELKEVTARPSIKRMWDWIANHTIPHFKVGYTIGYYYAQFFKEKYNVDYSIVRNATIYKDELLPPYNLEDPYILYQGAVNEGRCFEELIPAMQFVNCKLIICGKGNFYEKAKAMVSELNLEDKIIFKGYIQPADLPKITRNATIGITLFDADNVLSNYYSMANRFFDYMHSGVPQLCNAYPEYQKVNESYPLAYLLENISVQTIAEGLNAMLSNPAMLQSMRTAALSAKKEYCWQEEEKRLLAVYSQVF